MTVTLSSGLRDAKELLQKFGVLNERKSELVSLLDRVVQVDEERVTKIAEVIQYIDDFCDLVSKNVGEMSFSDRYTTINRAFTSIRDDSQRMIDQLGDGKVSRWERISNKTRYFFSGTPHDRFIKAFETFYGVCDDVKVQLSKEDTIINGYQNFREVFKEAQIMSLEVKAKQADILKSVETVFKSAFDAFTNYQGSDEAEKARLELARDKSEREYKREKRNFELLTNVSNDLQNTYGTSRNIVECLESSHENKDGLYQRSISYVETHRLDFTLMDAAYAQLYGLNEQARSFKELKDGFNQGLKQVGKIAAKVNNATIEQRYGVSVDPEAVREFNNDLTNYVSESVKLAEQHSNLETKAVAEIKQITEEGVATRQKLAYAFLEAERKDLAELPPVEDAKALIDGTIGL